MKIRWVRAPLFTSEWCNSYGAGQENRLFRGALAQVWAGRGNADALARQFPGKIKNERAELEERLT